MRILQWPGGRGREEGGEEGGEEGEPAVLTLALSPGRLPKGQRGQQDKELSSFASRFRLGGWPGRSPTQSPCGEGAVLLEKPEPFLQERSSPPTAP